MRFSFISDLNILINVAVLHNIFRYFILFLCFQIVQLATYIVYFPKWPPFLFPYRNLKSYSVDQMLHFLLQKIQFKCIVLQEILFCNYKINVVFQDDVYKNGNILEPEIIPFCLIYIQYILCYGLISIETLESCF